MSHDASYDADLLKRVFNVYLKSWSYARQNIHVGAFYVCWSRGVESGTNLPPVHSSYTLFTPISYHTPVNIVVASRLYLEEINIPIILLAYNKYVSMTMPIFPTEIIYYG